ncbi:MAG: SH3 domain-containing protein [Oscillospiraceae bacterium]
MSNNKKSSKGTFKMKIGGVALILLAMILVVFLLSKLLFKSNTSEIPEGFYTGTVTTTVSKPATTTKKSAQTTKSSDKNQTSTTSKKSDAGSNSNTNTAYATDYLILRKNPQKDGQNYLEIMPGEPVQVIEKLDNGFTKVTYAGLEGYVSSDYISYDANYTTTAQTTQASQSASQ